MEPVTGTGEGLRSLQDYFQVSVDAADSAVPWRKRQPDLMKARPSPKRQERNGEEDDDDVVVELPASKGAASKSVSKRSRVAYAPLPPPGSMESGVLTSDKWIVCTTCDTGEMHWIYPTWAGNVRIPMTYAQMYVGENRVSTCGECPGYCKKCGKRKGEVELLVCDRTTCQDYVCIDCLKTTKTPILPIYCSSVCRAQTEHVQSTGVVLPHCSEALGAIDEKAGSQRLYWFMCSTCGICACVACASICHSGHNVVPAIRDERSSSFYGYAKCRCGELKCCTPLGPVRNMASIARRLVALSESLATTTKEIARLDAVVSAERNAESKLTEARDTCNTRYIDYKKEWDAVNKDVSELDFKISIIYGRLAVVRGTMEEQAVETQAFHLRQASRTLLERRVKLTTDKDAYLKRLMGLDLLINEKQALVTQTRTTIVGLKGELIAANAKIDAILTLAHQSEHDE